MSFYGQPTYKMKPIHELVKNNYQLDNEELFNWQELLKSDDPILTGTPGLRNTIYGARLFYQINTEANIFAVLPKVDFEKSGFRVLTTPANVSGGGVAENSAIPDTTKPTLAQIEVGKKEVATSFEMSLKALNLETEDDSVKWAQMSEYMGIDHRKLLNLHLTADAETGLAGNNLESIDRAVGSYAELVTCGLTAGRLDFQGLDRDAEATYADAYVNCAASNRPLTIKLIRDTIANLEPFWDRPQNKIILTGYDTAAQIAELYEPQQRYQDYVNVETSFNGVRVVGRDTGFRAATFDGIPIIRSNDIKKDGSSRIYILDLDYIGIGVIQPTTLWSSDNFIELNKFARKAAYYTSGDLFATKFRCHGKIRDLT